LVRREAILDGTGSFEQKRRNFNKLSICFENKAQSHSEPRRLYIMQKRNNTGKLRKDIYSSSKNLQWEISEDAT
jgi:hypothetical protein